MSIAENILLNLKKIDFGINKNKTFNGTKNVNNNTDSYNLK